MRNLPRRRAPSGPLIYNPGDPCRALREAVAVLRDAYGTPRTRYQIDAWNGVERALDQQEEILKNRKSSA